MEWLLIAGILIFGVLATWVRFAGDREQDILGEEPTLNTRGPDD